MLRFAIFLRKLRPQAPQGRAQVTFPRVFPPAGSARPGALVGLAHMPPPPPSRRSVPSVGGRRPARRAAPAPGRGTGPRDTGRSADEGVRLQRVLAEAGVAARREAERLIAAGRVEVNGTVVPGLPYFVDPRVDRISVDGRPLPRAKQTARRAGPIPGSPRRIYVMLYKPQRVMTTTQDEGGRTTVMDLVRHPSATRLLPAGRLEFHTAGFVLLTNDGELIHRLTHASFAVPKAYELTVRGNLDQARLAEIAHKAKVPGVPEAFPEVPDESAPPPPVRILRQLRGSTPDADDEDRRAQGGPRTVLEVAVGEALQRRLIKGLELNGHRVTKSVQVGIGPLRLKHLRAGEWRELDRDEIRMIRKAAGMGSRGGARNPAPPAPAGPRPRAPIQRPRPPRGSLEGAGPRGAELDPAFAVGPGAGAASRPARPAPATVGADPTKPRRGPRVLRPAPSGGRPPASTGPSHA